MNASLEKPALRRAPQQARAQHRVETILDAAEAEFGDTGYEATTTNQIAARADVSIGSLYQFFPNKEAILQAVAQRYAKGFLDAFQASLPTRAQDDSDDIDSIDATVHALIDGTLAFGLKHAGFVNIALHAVEGSAVWAVTQRHQQILIEQIASLIHAFAAKMSLGECRLHARIAQSAIRAHCALAISEHLAGNASMAKRIIDQAKEMQSAYFTHVIHVYQNR